MLLVRAREAQGEEHGCRSGTGRGSGAGEAGASVPGHDLRPRRWPAGEGRPEGEGLRVREVRDGRRTYA